MTEHTTPANWSPRLQNIRKLFDTVLSNNPLTKQLPALHGDDYDFYLESVLKISPLHTSKIYYKGLEVRKLK